MRILLFGIAIWAGALSAPALASICGQSEAIVSFAEQLAPPTATEPPDGIADKRPALEAYRVKLELYRLNGLEIYNQAIKSFDGQLDQIDSDARDSMRDRRCAAAEYEQLKKKIIDERKKLAPFRQKYRIGYNSYQQWMEWYQEQIFRK